MESDEPASRRAQGLGRLTASPPLAYSKALASQCNCDLAIPNGPGLGNIILYSRLVEDMGWHIGRPLRIASCPMALAVGHMPGESSHPVWANHPFVSEVVDPRSSTPKAEANLLSDKDDLCQFGHITANLCSAYGIPNRANYGALYPTRDDMMGALATLSGLRRPIVCAHPGGKTSSHPSSPWFAQNWLRLRDELSSHCTLVRIGLPVEDQKGLDIPRFDTTVRQMMALIWASDAFVGFDSGPCHIAAAFRKPSVVLWDILLKRQVEVRKEPGFEAAMLLRWSYPQNDNVMIYGERQNESLEEVTKRLRRHLSLLDR